MKPSFRKAGNPASHALVIPALRRAAIPMVLLATTALAGCATTNPPPEISYDNFLYYVEQKARLIGQ